MKRLMVLVAAVVLLGFVCATSDAAAPFYQGKTLRVTVGFSAGGGFDLWARVVARHLGKHIPGNPTVIVENITGAGGLIQVNQLFKATKPDGLTLGHINGGLILGQMMDQPGYDFDPNKFIYIGAANKENAVFVFGKKSGITSAEKWRTSPTPVKIGGLVPGNFVDNMDRLMKDVLGFPTQIITGYKGTADILIATDSGELAGGPPSWDNVKTNRKRALEVGDMIVVIQCTAKPLKELPNVPKIVDFAKTDEQKKLVQIAAVYANDYSRPFAVPPGTPKERVDILRKAFQETMKDAEFLAEVEKMQMTLDYTSGEDMANAVVNSAKIDAATKAKLKDILFK
ncbi:MAG TPA: tripartite tricarboxylate transporter substrate-binding protein [Syntrophorhabdales bacterium]|nr:tripartite tricarboxylate transporter substrate-binding protein [Syntrophorhabdales bacterium]